MEATKLFYHPYAIVSYTTVEGCEFDRWCRSQEEVDRILVNMLFDSDLHVTFHSVTYYET
jgi:hypothetical protein